MNKYILKAINWFAGSADNHPGGASSKKLTAFWALVAMATPTQIVWMIWAFKNNNWDHLQYIVTADFALVVSALGINSHEKIKGKADTGTKEEPKTPPAE